jgi:hypothetical protein
LVGSNEALEGFDMDEIYDVGRGRVTKSPKLSVNKSGNKPGSNKVSPHLKHGLKGNKQMPGGDAGIASYGTQVAPGGFVQND